jgi:cell division protein FtsB
MAEFGYREHIDHNPFLKKIISKKISIFIGGVLVVVVLVTFSNKGLLSRFKLEQEFSQKTAHITLLKKEISELKRKRDLLQKNPEAIEHVAREMHGMIRKGETVYKVIPASTQ